MSFTPIRNLRLSSLTVGAVGQLRFGKAAVRSADDVVVTVKLVGKRQEGEKTLLDFEESSPEGGETSVTTISRFPGAPWKANNQYVSLVGIDESTYTVQKAATPIQTDAIGKAVDLINAEREDVFGADQLIALLLQVKNGKRVNNEIKALAIQLANKLIDELSALSEDKD